MNVRTIISLLGLILITGCSVLPTGVDPLPYFETRNEGIDTVELCKLYRKYNFTTDNCQNESWSVSIVGDIRSSDQLMHRRNELQEEIKAIATSKCNEFRKKITGQAQKGLISTETASLVLSAAATVVNPTSLSKSLAGGAAATTGIARLLDENYENILQTALDGIELGRTKVHKQIAEQQEKSLLEYPLSRAVNDALRYHSACNLKEGLTEVSNAVATELNKEEDGDDDNGDDNDDDNDNDDDK